MSEVFNISKTILLFSFSQQFSLPLVNDKEQKYQKIKTGWIILLNK